MLDQENRQWQRIPVAFEAKCRDVDSAFTPYHRTEIVDITHEGCRVVGSGRFKRGQVVSLLVDLPHEGSLHMQAVAAWSAPVYKNAISETGLRFITEDRAAEETYMKLYHFCLLRQSRI
jgi:hypothetical protein